MPKKKDADKLENKPTHLDFVIWASYQFGNLSHEEIGKKFGYHRNTVRIIINRFTAFLGKEFEPETVRNALVSMIPDAAMGLQTGLLTADASMINGFFRGIGVYQEKTKHEHTGKVVIAAEQQIERMADMADKFGIPFDAKKVKSDSPSPN